MVIQIIIRLNSSHILLEFRMINAIAKYDKSFKILRVNDNFNL
jgi:hypothetical protein